ncbi:Ring finger domain containing protein, putative [Trypanosoma equiperdum]|uniref:RING-type E3 ubiquitin transferase n=4 Tax=Trypanozoon TaxID=39700 RepID=Q57VJ2_TRYB2|nr:hypothetical protein, conserved [Trypanosoma brucei gambiense DAL972]XP_846242.1 hypothetical protein, conserved [Trypanosoma brucei brucei TREU927]AAX70377.1 hypothetical protein, conserved [Trypanosoma brucei]RHW71560.1 Ring finger domain containing protein [Trypanosoma brucei equiperdum]SCU66175.1 Ring finger domain containing protein, putative [Trypanosoma equiperdum]AAZ12683.1 hypothetical protein, conserved [Trypanosoma brucei brucei TREU927]CBH12826.1 hypothetical protein, conserved|eukprot:XP_011775105.1 hypothetical protein, conserved [Trypanosoma brucei gambiense DAL972]
MSKDGNCGGCSAPWGKMPQSPMTPLSDARDSPTAPLCSHSAFSKVNKESSEEESFVVGKYQTSMCPICLESFTHENPAVVVGCGHSFHLQCVEDWRQRSPICPVCMIVLRGDGLPMHTGRQSQRPSEVSPSQRKGRATTSTMTSASSGTTFMVTAGGVHGRVLDTKPPSVVNASAGVEGSGSVVDVGNVSFLSRVRRCMKFCCTCEDDL